MLCAGPPCHVNTLYPFAPVGAVLPGGVQDREAKDPRRDIGRHALLTKELGLGQIKRASGAVTRRRAGNRFLEAMPIGDTRLVIDVLPNRPELCPRGLAREIAAATGRNYEQAGDRRGKVVRYPHAQPSRRLRKGGRLTVAEDTTAVWLRALSSRGLKVGPSPDWLVQRLPVCGIAL